MKRKYLDRPEWPRILSKRFISTYIENEELEGHLAVLYLDEVSNPLVLEILGRDRCLVNEGYIWLEYLPAGHNYCVTAMINDKKEVVQWYFDIIKGCGFDDRGIPFFDDIYLDVSVLPSKDILLLDEDELKEAVETKDITEEDYDMAYNQARSIMENIDVDKLMRLTFKYLNYISLLNDN